ncbi:unnamed protein product, partial [Heligmosomoides polygyrus]
MKGTEGLFGPRSEATVTMMSKEVTALLDTGSETSIIPITLFRKVRQQGVDLDEYVETIPMAKAVVRNASGAAMNFLGAVRMHVTLNNETRPVSFYIGKGMGEVVILGTNALEQFHIRLVSEGNSNQQESGAVVKERAFIPPHSSNTVELLTKEKPGDYFLCSKDPCIASGICTVKDNGTATVSVLNRSNEAKVLRRGDVVGSWSNEEWIPTQGWETGTDMLEGGTREEIDDQKRATEAIAAARPEDADNSALLIFFVCPGAGRRSNGHEIEDYGCSVRDLTFADVVPCELDPVVRSLKFSSIFSLAQMISIYENEVDVDKKRYLMRTPSYNFVTISGVEKAYTFFKRHCEHLLKTLLRHDGSNIAIIAKDAVDMELAQLNDLTNTGIRYAMTHSWEEISIEGPKKQTLIMVPNGVRGCARVLRAEDNVTISAYRDLRNAATTVRDHKDVGVCIFVTPTSEKPYDAAEWQALAMTMTKVARCGGKLLLVSGPRGEQAWEKNRSDAHSMFEVIRSAATAVKGNVVSLFSTVPSMTEPLACLGESNRPSEVAVYPAQSTKAYFKALQDFLAPHVRGRLYELLSEPVPRKAAYKDKRRILH